MGNGFWGRQWQNTKVVFFQAVDFYQLNCKTALEAKEKNRKCCHMLHGWPWASHLTSLCLIFPIRVLEYTLPCRHGRKAIPLRCPSLRAGWVGWTDGLLWDAGNLGSISCSITCFLRMSVLLSLQSPLLGKEAWFNLSTPLSLSSKQWDWHNFVYTPWRCVAQVGPSTDLPHSGLLWSQRSPAAWSSWKHLCCLLVQHLPGNQATVEVNSGIFITFKMELGGFWSCCPQLTGLLKAFLWAFFWLPSQHAAGSTTGKPV